MALVTKEQAGMPRDPGIGFLGNGQPYISGWPSNQKPINLARVNAQSLEEAALWCGKARVAAASITQ